MIKHMIAVLMLATGTVAVADGWDPQAQCYARGGYCQDRNYNDRPSRAYEQDGGGRYRDSGSYYYGGPYGGFGSPLFTALFAPSHKCDLKYGPDGQAYAKKSCKIVTVGKPLASEPTQVSVSPGSYDATLEPVSRPAPPAQTAFSVCPPGQRLDPVTGCRY